MILFDKHRRARKNLSAYVDGELSKKEAQRLEGHLETCERCQLELNGLRSAIEALRGLPEVAPQRSFALTPQMVAPPQPSQRAGPSPALVQGMRLTAAGLAAALVLVFVIDVSDSGTSNEDAGGTVAGLTRDGAAEQANDLASAPAGDGETLQPQEYFGGKEEATSVPEADGVAPPDSGVEATAVPAPSPAQLSGIGGAPDDAGSAGAGGAGGGDASDDSASEPPDSVAEPDEQTFSDDGQTRATNGPAAAAEDDSNNPEKAVDQAGDLANGNADADDAAGQPEQAISPSAEDDGGFDTLLAIEIGLVAALAVALGCMIWLTLASRRGELR